MSTTQRPVLQLLLLLAIGLRTVFGAPCCIDMNAAGGHHHHAAHAHHDHSVVGDAGDEDKDNAQDSAANPCCSACGPTLPPDTAPTLARLALRETPVATPILTLATRPPFPAYDATGPPASV
ncbi:MAG: hypothetical protein AAF553_02520 [Pseudomonadota bacterium]